MLGWKKGVHRYQLSVLYFYGVSGWKMGQLGAQFCDFWVSVMVSGEGGKGGSSLTNG
jgi:hypothetical protein